MCALTSQSVYRAGSRAILPWGANGAVSGLFMCSWTALMQWSLQGISQKRLLSPKVSSPPQPGAPQVDKSKPAFP